MPTYLSPGVYVEEVDRGSKPIEGVGTAVAAFVGFAESGPINEPVFIANWTQFVNAFGGFLPGGYLAHGVYGYFHNGGGSCYVTRLPGGEAADGAEPAARAALPGRAGAAESLTFTALQPGAAGAGISIEVAPPGEGGSEEAFNLIVRGGGAEETYENLTLGRGRNVRNAVDVVNRESKLVRVAEAQAAGSLAERAPAAGTYSLAVASRAVALPQLSPATFVGETADR